MVFARGRLPLPAGSHHWYAGRGVERARRGAHSTISSGSFSTRLSPFMLINEISTGTGNIFINTLPPSPLKPNIGRLRTSHTHTQHQLTPCCRHCKARLLSTFTTFSFFLLVYLCCSYAFSCFLFSCLFVCFASLFLCQTCGPLFRLYPGLGNLLNVVSAFTHRRQTIKLLKWLKIDVSLCLPLPLSLPLSHPAGMHFLLRCVLCALFFAVCLSGLTLAVV